MSGYKPLITIKKMAHQMFYVASIAAIDAVIKYLSSVDLSAVGSGDYVVVGVLLALVRGMKNWLKHRKK